MLYSHWPKCYIAMNIIIAAITLGISPTNYWQWQYKLFDVCC